MDAVGAPDVAVEPAERSYLRVRLNRGAAIRILHIDAGRVGEIQDLLQPAAAA